MTPQMKMTVDAEAAAVRYNLLVEGWKLLYANALKQVAINKPGLRLSIEREAYQMGHTYLTSERAIVEDATAQIAQKALTDARSDLQAVDTRTDMSQAVSEHLSASDAYLLHELAIQVERDIAFLKSAVSQALLNINLASRAQGRSFDSALLEYRIGIGDNLRFYFHDRRNMKWPSNKFVRAVWRRAMLSVYNEVILLTAADHGMSMVRVDHVNASAESNGMLISLFSNTDIPTYAEIRDTLFHPNSDAILKLNMPESGNVHS